MTMSAPDRGRAYIELSDELLTASTPAEFRQLLSRIMTEAGLTASQIAVKTGIPRSQAYSMVSSSRISLPSKREQVQRFVEACGLAPVQAGLVMSVWDRLIAQQVREQENGTVRSPNDEDSTSDSTHSGTSDSAGTSDEASHRRSASYRPREFIDLLFLVLEDDARTRRALQLLIPVALAIAVVVASLAAWAILQPNRAPLIGGLLGVAFAIPAAAAAAFRRERARLRKRKPARRARLTPPGRADDEGRRRGVRGLTSELTAER